MFRRTAALLAAACAVAAGSAAPVAAQARVVTIAGPAQNPLREATPRFDVTTSGFPASDPVASLRIEVAFSVDFAAPFFADTTIPGASASVVIPRLLPPNVDVFWRAVARQRSGALTVTDAVGPRRTSTWLSLIQPNGLNGITVSGNRPVFQWTSPTLLPPVAPWRYSILITYSNGGQPAMAASTSDSAFVPFADLESNTSYRWSVTAVAGTGDSIRVASSSTFVILSPNAPLTTLLYAPFPNPFPNPRLNATCIWFDLRTTSTVSLDVLDLRGTRVRKLLPRADLGTSLGAGRFGRATFGSDSGCDSRFTWDGTDDAGRIVPPGVYLIRLTANGRQFIQKTLFKGR